MHHKNHAPKKVKRRQSAPSWPALIQTRARISPGVHLEKLAARRAPRKDGKLHHFAEKRRCNPFEEGSYRNVGTSGWVAADGT